MEKNYKQKGRHSIHQRHRGYGEEMENVIKLNSDRVVIHWSESDTHILLALITPRT